jgi:hypothetical protein
MVKIADVESGWRRIVGQIKRIGDNKIVSSRRRHARHANQLEGSIDESLPDIVATPALDRRRYFAQRDHSSRGE